MKQPCNSQEERSADDQLHAIGQLATVEDERPGHGANDASELPWGGDLVSASCSYAAKADVFVRWIGTAARLAGRESMIRALEREFERRRDRTKLAGKDGRAILVHVSTGRRGDAERSMSELGELAVSSDLAVIDRITQRMGG